MTSKPLLSTMTGEQAGQSRSRGQQHELKDGFLANAIPLGNLAGALRQVLACEGWETLKLIEKALILENWLQWSQCDSHGRVRIRWAHLRSLGAPDISNRDEVVLRLWELMTQKETGKHGVLKDHIEAEYGPWSFYERHFFGWFLARFNLKAARALFPESRLVGSLHWLALLGVLALAILWLGFLEPTLLAGMLGFGVATLALVLLLWRVSKLALSQFAGSLIPRLGVTVGIGYLFLAAAPQLIKAVFEAQQKPWRLWLVVAALVLGVFAYVMLHISRRVFPALPWKELMRRAFDVMILGTAYSVAGLVLARPVLFQPSFFCGSDESCLSLSPPLAGHLVLYAAVALAIGVVLQLAWEEKPLTEPL